MFSTTMKQVTINGIPGIMIPNDVIEADGFYISYNNYDIGIYGCDTTALCYDYQNGINGVDFFILDGNHLAEYRELMKQGFWACYRYFEDNQSLKNKYSQDDFQYPDKVRK